MNKISIVVCEDGKRYVTDFDGDGYLLKGDIDKAGEAIKTIVDANAADEPADASATEEPAAEEPAADADNTDADWAPPSITDG